VTARNMARPLTLLTGLAILVAACGGSAATATPGAPAASNGSSAAPVTAGPVATSGAEPTFVMPSLPTGDAALEELLPDEIAGETVTKLSMTGDQFMGTGNAEVEAVLQQFNKTPADLSVAFGGTAALALIAYQLKGVDGGQFFDAFVAASDDEGQVTVTDANYSGKAVKKVVSPDSEIGTVYVYTSGDVMYIVGGAGVTDALLTEAFSKIG
jgi:hypothetical protein